MKKIRSKFVFIFLILTLICSCKSTEPANKEKFTDKEKGIENETEINLEEILEEEFSFEEEYYKDVVWRDALSLQEVEGRWETPEGLLQFPYKLDNNEYLCITAPAKDDTNLWQDFAAKKALPLEQIWKNRFYYIPEVYGINYPLSDENGNQLGLKLEYNSYDSIGKIIITSNQVMLIPTSIVKQNLAFFKLSQDGKKIKAEGGFRFFSQTFSYLYDSFILPQEALVQSSPKYGVVLSGGGGKGAYEVGVWKAFLEYGIAQKTRVISGTSVGGLNSALFAIRPYDEIERIWINNVPTKLTQNDALISQEGLNDIISSIPLVKLREISFPQVYVTAVKNRFLLAKLVKSKPGQYASRFNLNSEESISQIKKKLLATSAFPVLCPPVKLADGFEYSDGGNEAVGGDNTPISPVVDNHLDIDTIFIVYLAHEPARKIKEIDYDTKHLVQIIPSIELGGILDGTANFTANRIKLLIKYGYEDAVSVLQKNGYYPVSPSWFEEVKAPTMEDILALYSEEQ